MVGAVVLFVSMSVQSAAPSSGDVIKIGIVASLSGPLIPWGTDAYNGAQLAVDQVNASGGIAGRQVELLVQDCASTPEGGKIGTEALIAAGVVGLLGTVSSGITQPMARVSSEHGIPHVVVGGTKSGLTKDPNVFRVCYTDDFQGPVMAKFAYDTLGLRKVALMTDSKQPYSSYLSESFRKFFVGLGGEIVAEQFYESGQSNFLYELVKIKEGDPEGIFLSGYFNEVGPIAMQAGQVGLEDVKLLGGDGWESMELIDSGGDAIIGGFFCNHYSNDEQRPEVQNFVTAWRERHDDPPGTSMGALGYDAAALLMDAIARAGSTDAEAVIEALGNTVGFKGVTGAITLKGLGGDAARPALVLRVTRDGFVPAKTMSYEEVYGGDAGSGVLRKNTK